MANYVIDESANRVDCSAHGTTTAGLGFINNTTTAVAPQRVKSSPSSASD
jgi:hypothetical protein